MCVLQHTNTLTYTQRPVETRCVWLTIHGCAVAYKLIGTSSRCECMFYGMRFNWNWAKERDGEWTNNTQSAWIYDVIETNEFYWNLNGNGNEYTAQLCIYVCNLIEYFKRTTIHAHDRRVWYHDASRLVGPCWICLELRRISVWNNVVLFTMIVWRWCFFFFCRLLGGSIQFCMFHRTPLNRLYFVFCMSNLLSLM